MWTTGIIEAKISSRHRRQGRLMKARNYLLMAIFLMCSGMASAAKPIQNMIDVAVPANIDGSSKSLEQVKNGIIAGCKYKRWVPVEEEPGKISCSISVRAKHYAEVEITHTESSYSINYKDSRDLDYNEKKQKIHRNYNKWVILLSEAITTELAKSQG